MPPLTSAPNPRAATSALLAEAQHSRIVRAATTVVDEHGYGGMSVALIINRAGVSRRTFYDLFENGEDCFLTALDDALAQLASVVAPAYRGDGRWSERVRAALAALLAFLEYEPAIASLVFVEALRGGQHVLDRLARVLEILKVAVEEGQSQASPGRPPPRLTA